MKVVIRTDASVYIGSGHVMRCLVLAHALKKKGCCVEFVSRPQLGDLVSFIRTKGFVVHELRQPLDGLGPAHTEDYAAWLQVSWQEDAQNFLTLIGRADLVVVDHYGIGQDWEKVIKSELACGLFVIDDLVRSHCAELLLDQTLSRQIDEYKNCCPKAVVLAGCNYALIKPDFTHYRERSLDDVKEEGSHNVLITMGGIDQPNATLRVLGVFDKQETQRPHVTVLLGSKAPHYSSVKSFCERNSSWVTHIEFVENMAELMSKHSVAIGAAGSTSWERACLGIPSIIIPLAENQHTICENLVKSEAAICVELDEIEDKLCSSLGFLLSQWFRYRSANLSLCDGLGTQRVMHEIEVQFDKKRCGQLSVRNALAKDLTKVFELQCKPETRRYAINSNTPSWDEHRDWMEGKLKSDQDYFYILEWRDSVTKIVDVGVVRLDRARNAHYVISIFIDPKYHGKGIARQALKFVDEIHSNITIEAIVLIENLASQKLFESANYDRVKEDTYIRQPIT